MSESAVDRIDQVARAEEILRWADRPGLPPENVAALSAAAQAHATLALVEQQRIANFLAMASRRLSDAIESEEAAYTLAGTALYEGLLVPVATSPDDEHYEIRADIRKALGLS